MSSSAAIQIVGLSKAYRRRRAPPIEAVRDLDLLVPSGQVFGFLGPNGAGKTTTIKMVCGLVRPTRGKVLVNGYDVWRQHRPAVQQLGAVLEGTRNVHWSLSAWDNLLYFGHLRGMYGQALAARTETLLNELGLWDRRRELVGTFSRGMQQKVAIACALIANPPIILLDEPTLGLDVQAARVVQDMVRRLAAEHSKTVVLTTHQLRMAQELCDRVAIIRAGRVIADQPVEQLLRVSSEPYYRIAVEGQLHTEGVELLASMSVEAGDGKTLLSGPIADQDALFRLLDLLRDQGLSLLSVRQEEPNLEEVFVRLVDGDKAH
ncbi:MAG TPA: ABC transporter ATP-binding protein [Anaerolineae bacterium]|nr:ABC transporter ATP-binding protein [Anaerolineae bacterium]